MAVKKTVKTKKTSKITVQVKKTVTPQKKRSRLANLTEYLRFGESYTSLVLGIIAVIVVTILLLSLFNNRQGSKPNEEIVPTIAETLDITLTPTPVQSQSVDSKTYTVISGDNLWKIAEKTYGSGYSWVEIAKANKLTNPNQINAGNKLILPKTAKDATVKTGENEAQVSRTARVMDTTYTVAKGDDLWDIAVRSYGDGYQWTKIAKANNLTNANIVHVGNILKIPRN